MFEGLKNRLQQIQGRLGSGIQPDPETSRNQPEGASPSPVSPVGATGSGSPAPSSDASPGFFRKVRVLVSDRQLIISERDLADILSELEIVLLENDVALSVTDEIIAGVRAELVGGQRRIGESVDEVTTHALRSAIRGVLGDGLDLVSYIRSHERPVKILFTGVNGTGKTTTVAKVGAYLKAQGLTVVIGAGDTFRAGAIEQIDIHAERLGIRVIQHQSGADPSAVLFDAVSYAKAHEIDVVLADTAGRFHNRANLMNQLAKIKRVMKPDLVVYVDEAVAGNDAVTRAEEFDRTVGADGIILTKADMDPRGGAALSIAHTIGKPLIFLGTGQGYADLVPFEPSRVVDELIGGSP